MDNQIIDHRGYCMKCKSKVELKNTERIWYKNGVPAEKGICIKCNNKVVRILTTAERAESKVKQEAENKNE
mgnify:CR=1 FL=1